MLNKIICTKCRMETLVKIMSPQMDHERERKVFLKLWRYRNTCACLYNVNEWGNELHLKVTDPPPIDCPYKLEQMLSQSE